MRYSYTIATFVLFSGAYLFSQMENSIALLDPEMAQDPLVMHGFHLMEQTTKYAPEYAHAHLSCNSCHFNGGNSLGGQRNGIPLVGVTQKYVTTQALEKRINLCFQHSLSGRPVPFQGPEMQGLIAYMDWISKPVILLKDRPWLGTKSLKTKYLGNFETGKTLFAAKCAECHGKKGEGSQERPGDSIPPLWGRYSFNSSAGMAKPEMFAWFIFWNMPPNDPSLSEREALDIAAFVSEQQRPSFK